MSKKTIPIDRIHIPRWNELPNVDLYLDQIVTFINTSLAKSFDIEEKDNPVLTKTMINNYVKNNLIEAPIKKKYSKSQCAKLFVICILKQVYSMDEISKLIDIAIKSSDIAIAYDSFCTQFEQTLKFAYNKTGFDELSNIVDDNKYLLKAVLISCSYKVFVKNMIS